MDSLKDKLWVYGMVNLCVFGLWFDFDLFHFNIYQTQYCTYLMEQWLVYGMVRLCELWVVTFSIGEDSNRYKLDGIKVGIWDGAIDGSRLGIWEGDSLGVDVGIWEGLIVGMCDGDSVGYNVGMWDGVIEGIIVGMWDGLIEG